MLISLKPAVSAFAETHVFTENPPKMKIVQTANDGRDHPNENFVNLPYLTKKSAEKIAKVLNDRLSGGDPFIYPYYFKIVEDDYELSSPFEP